LLGTLAIGLLLLFAVRAWVFDVLLGWSGVRFGWLQELKPKP
jgi:hypothetical protein